MNAPNPVRYWSDEEQSCYINFRSMITKSNGFFKSEKQAHLYLNGSVLRPFTFYEEKGKTAEEMMELRRKEFYRTYGIMSEPGTHIFLVRGTVSFGVMTTRQWGNVFIVDKDGIIAQYKLRFKYDKSVGSKVSKEDGELVFERRKGAVNPNYKSVEVGNAEKAAAKEAKIEEVRQANAHIGYLGEIKQRMDFEGVVESIKFMGQQSYGFHTTSQYRTIIKTKEGHTIVHWNSIGEEGKGIRFKATVKAHDEYKGIKQTTVLRPANIEIFDAGPAQQTLQLTVATNENNNS